MGAGRWCSASRRKGTSHRLTGHVPAGDPRTNVWCTGAEYAAIPFQVLHDRLYTALRGTRPRLVLEVIGPDSTPALVFEDGSTAPGPPFTK